jgi:hypothetical protein
MLGPEGTWPFGSGPAGYIEGLMHVVGFGVRPGAYSPLAGVVEIVRPRETTVLVRIAVNRTGRFRVLLPEGEYQVIGRPNNGGMTLSVVVGVSRGRTERVDLVEQST